MTFYAREIVNFSDKNSCIAILNEAVFLSFTHFQLRILKYIKLIKKYLLFKVQNKQNWIPVQIQTQLTNDSLVPQSFFTLHAEESGGCQFRKYKIYTLNIKS